MYKGKRRYRLTLVSVLLLGAIAAAVIVLVDPLGHTLKEVTLPLRHDDVIRQQAKEKDLDPALIAAVIYGESRFRPRKSKAGAVGLMQIMPDTALFIAKKSGGTKFEIDDLGDPQVNIAYGSWYMHFLSERYNERDLLVLAAYNAGHNRVDKWRARARARGESISRVDQIPLSETRSYVRTVLEAQVRYREKYADELGYR